MKTSEAKIASSQVSHNEANKKHQAEIAVAQEQKLSLSNNVEQLTKKLTETETSLQQKAAEALKSQEALKSIEVKVTSYQEEAASLRHDLNTSNAAITKLKQIHFDMKSENELSILQIGQLQEELEITFAQGENALEQHAKKLAELEANIQQKVTQLGSSQDAFEASEAKVGIAQATFEEANKKHQEESESLKRDLSVSYDEMMKLKQNNVDMQSENELLILQIGQLQEELESIFAQGENELKQHAKKLIELEAIIQQKVAQLGSSQNAFKASEVKVGIMQADFEEVNKKYQQETASLKHDLESSYDHTMKFKQNNVDVQSENELLILQIGQLQEELESTNSQSTNELQQMTHDIDKKNEQLKEILAIEKGLLQQIVKLEEAISIQKTEFAEIASKALALNTKKQLDVKDNEMNKAEFTLQLRQRSEENDLFVLQIGQLQEELEALYLSNQQLSSQKNEQNQLLDRQSEVQQQMQAIEAENEIATLQINQLQEELEFYYQQLQEKESKILTTQLDNLQVSQNIFEKSTFEIKGGYETDGYKDIHLLLSDVHIADGRQFSKLSVKLIEVDGRPGVEFRPADKTDESAPLQWREDMQDEYGYFICFIPLPNSEQSELQQKTNENLCASDRLLILSIASKLADIFQMTTENDLPDGKLRDWKLIAINLKNQLATLPNWMSFDALTLVEEMRTNNYEHLWLRFNNLLVNDHLRREFEVKFAVTDSTGSGEVFSNNIMLEIRQQANQQPPLQAWPPLTQDEYGYKLQVFVDLTEDELNIHVEEKLSDSDYQFIRHLVKNMVNFLQALVDQGQNLERPVQDWFAIANRITQISEVNPEIEQDLIVSEEEEEEEKSSVTPTLKPVFTEYVDLGGYQHLLYKQLLPNNKELLIKIRAENINLQTKVAELYLELRTGDDQVPLADSEYYDEDEFGPRVLLPFAILQTDLFNQQNETPELKLVNLFSQEMTSLIETNSELEEPQRELWQAMLRRELWQAMLINK